MKNRYVLILGLCFMTLLLGCYPRKNTYINEYDIVGTNYSKDFNFSAYKSYALPDSIVLIDGNTYSGKNKFLDQATANLIFNQIRSNLNAMGWVEKDKSVCDMIILPSVFKNTTVSYYYSYGYWGWYYPGYNPGYSWGYPYYPTGGYTTSYTTGTLFMQMTYPAGIESTSVPVVWSGLINGLINTGSSSSINSRIKTNIDQAFKQSQYLK